MGSQTGTQYGRDIVAGPVNHLDQRVPEFLPVQGRVDYIGPGDDQRIQSVGLYLLKTLVIPVHVLPAFPAALQFLQGERVQVKPRYLVAFTDQPEELSLRGLQGLVRHHVQQADMQLAHFLAQGRVPGNDKTAFALKPRKAGQVSISYQRHQSDPFSCLSRTPAMTSMKSCSDATPSTSSLATV